MRCINIINYYTSAKYISGTANQILAFVMSVAWVLLIKYIPWEYLASAMILGELLYLLYHLWTSDIDS